MDFAGLAAKRLRDHINFGLQGQVFVSVSDFQRLFLQLCQGFGGSRLRLGVGSNFLRRGDFRLLLWCRFLFRVGSCVGCSCSLAYSSLTASCVSSPVLS